MRKRNFPKPPQRSKKNIKPTWNPCFDVYMLLKTYFCMRLRPSLRSSPFFNIRVAALASSTNEKKESFSIITSMQKKKKYSDHKSILRQKDKQLERKLLEQFLDEKEYEKHLWPWRESLGKNHWDSPMEQLKLSEVSIDMSSHSRLCFWISIERDGSRCYLKFVKDLMT